MNIERSDLCTGRAKLRELELWWTLQDAPKSPGNKDKTPKKTKIPTAQGKEIPAVPVTKVLAAAPPPPPPPVVEPTINQSTLMVDSLATMTTHEEKYVSARENLNSSMSTARTVEEQEIEQYAEQIEALTSEQLIGLIHQASFFHLVESVQNTILSKLLECSLTGASFYRNLMKIFRFILQSELDPHFIIAFTNSIHIPDLPLAHLKSILDHPNIRKEVLVALSLLNS